MTENEYLSRRLKHIRKNLNQSQIDFAANCGMSVEEVSLIERNIADPKLSTLQKLAAYSGLTVSDLLDTEENLL